jgi:hypothetical protein
MSKFSYEGKLNAGKEKLPLEKRVKKVIFNVKVAMFRDEQSELSSVRLSNRVLK